LFALATGPTDSFSIPTGKIKHFIGNTFDLFSPFLLFSLCAFEALLFCQRKVLMMENRSFDHLLGFMKRGGPNGDTRVNGLKGAALSCA
jgi:hypothetical protein